MKKSTYVLLATVALLISLAACTSKDQTSPASANNELVGTWSAYATHDSIYFKQAGTSLVKDSTYTGLYQEYIFHADNTCTLIDSTGTPGFVANLHYEVTNGKFILGLGGAYDTASISVAGNQFTLVGVKQNDADVYEHSTIHYSKL